MLHIKKLQQAVAIALLATTAVVGTTSSVSYGMELDESVQITEAKTFLEEASKGEIFYGSEHFELIYSNVQTVRNNKKGFDPQSDFSKQISKFTKTYMQDAQIFSMENPDGLPISTLIHYYNQELKDLGNVTTNAQEINNLILQLNKNVKEVTGKFSEGGSHSGADVGSLNAIRFFYKEHHNTKKNTKDSMKYYVYQNLLYPYFGSEEKKTLIKSGWLFGTNQQQRTLLELLDNNTQYQTDELYKMLRASYWLDMGFEMADKGRTTQNGSYYFPYVGDTDIKEENIPAVLKTNRLLRQQILAMLKETDEANFTKYVERSQEKIERHKQMLENFKNKQDKTILSLDGGGMRGLVHTEMLKEILKTIQKKDPTARIQDYIDGVTGTSTGGLIALGLSAEHPFFPGESAYDLYDIEAIYTTHGKTIFPKTYEGCTSAGEKFNSILEGTFKLTHQNTYDAEPLQRVLFGLLGPSRMSDALMPMMVATHNAKTKELFKISNFEKETSNFPMLYAARGTSAAPTYLPPIIINRIDKNSIALVDGGIGYNNPSLEFVNHIVRGNKLYNKKQSFNVLSMGTTLFPNKIDYKSNENAAALVGGFFLGSMDTAVTKAHTDLSSLFTSYHKGSTVVRWNPINDKEIDLAATDEDTLNGLKNLVTGWTNYFSAPDQYEGLFADFSGENKKDLPAYVEMAMEDMANQLKEQQEAYKNIFSEGGWIDRAIASHLKEEK